MISLSVLGACLIADIVYFLADPRTRTRSGVLMSALATPADPVPDAGLPAAVIRPPRGAAAQSRARPRWERRSSALFILVAIIGSVDRAV